MARSIRHPARRMAPFLALCVVALASERTGADDTTLFTASTPPNVMFIMDTSGSMNTVLWHPLFHEDAVYDPTNCPYTSDPTNPNYWHCLQYPLCDMPWAWAPLDGGSGDTWDNNDFTFRTLNGRTNITPPYAGCQTRDVYIDPVLQAGGNQTRWLWTYLRWYFSQNVTMDPDGDGQTILQDLLATNNGTTSACLLNEDPSRPATYAKYRRSRVIAARDVLRDVICQTSQVADLRYGLAKFQAASDPAGGYVVVPLAAYTSTQASLIETQIDALVGESWTPLGETLFNIYRYFQSRGTSLQALGKDGVTRFPKYNITTAGAISTSGVPAQPVTDRCQKHFVVLITDGEPTKDDFSNGSSSLLGTTFSTFDTNLIGHYNTPGDANEKPPNVYFSPAMTGSSCGGNGSSTETTCKIGLYVDDIAKFMHTQDFALDTAYTGTQTIDVYTVGFTTSPKANALLQTTADVGGGEFYTSNNPDDLAANITSVLNSIVIKSRSFTSAAVPASRTTSAENFYTAFFVPVNDTWFWEGHLKNFDFSAEGDVLTSDGHCAVGVDPLADPPCPDTGTIRTTANAFWDAASAMPTNSSTGVPDPTLRKLYVELGNTSMFGQPTAFTGSTNWFGLVSSASGDNTVLPYSTLTPTPISTTTMAAALIRNLRGCTFSTSSTCTPRLDTDGGPLYLGDIYHSNPVVVGSPNAAINEASYQNFASTNRQRTRVIYAGANDGFMHGFNAGNWDATASPPRFDRGTGQELMGFMPYGVRKTIKNFVKTVTGLRTAVNVDGSPVVADVWFNRQVVSGALSSTPNPKQVSKQLEQWRTVLMAGLRDGGQHYYALDITSPPASVSTSTTSYPRYLWSFPADDLITYPPVNPGTRGGISGRPDETPWMGNTWSEPVITRVRVRVDDAAASYERWVAIFGGGYSVEGDPNGSGYVATSQKGRAIYMVDINTGEVLAKKAFTSVSSTPAMTGATGEQQLYKEMRYSIPSSPAVFDLDFDGFADVIYIGDLGGNVWKWVVHAPGDDTIGGSNISTTCCNHVEQPQWPFRLWFRGEAQTSSGTTEPPAEMTGGTYNSAVNYQSFFFPPTGAMRNGKLVLAFGAGERANPISPAAEYTDGVTWNNNHYYVVKDADPLEQIGTAPDKFTGRIVETCSGPCTGEGDLANFDASTPLTCAEMNSTKAGYYITGRDAEKFISNSTIFLGKVFTGSFLQRDPASTDVCSGSGTSYLYSFDLDCGVGSFPTAGGSDQDDRRIAIGSGLPTRPRVSVGNGGGGGGGGGGGSCGNKLVLVTSDGGLYNASPGNCPSSGVKVRSWRER